MPVDNTKVISPRRTTKKLTGDEIKDIEQKRLRGQYDVASMIISDLCGDQASLRALNVGD